ncbi:MAG: FAD-binding protein [Thermomicrobiales bacterium]
MCGVSALGKIKQERVMGIGANWSGYHTFGATALHEPESLDAVRRIVSAAPKLHALGTRHCFNDIADSAELLSLARMPRELTVDRDASTVTINAGMTYGELGIALDAEDSRSTTWPRCRTSRWRARSRPPRTVPAIAAAISRRPSAPWSS